MVVPMADTVTAFTIIERLLVGSTTSLPRVPTLVAITPLLWLPNPCQHNPHWPDGAANLCGRTSVEASGLTEELDIRWISCVRATQCASIRGNAQARGYLSGDFKRLIGGS